MKLFKKHYEKFIFIIFLVLFVILFGIQAVSVISDQNERPEDKLRINLGRPDYKAINFQDDNFRIISMFSKVSSRVEGAHPADNMNIDLLVPPVLAKCPNGPHLIPVEDFPANEKEKDKKKCSFCNIKLEDIPLEKLESSDTAIKMKDTDNDGIPDVDEIRLGLNPNNPQDAALDDDKDGFTNLEEFLEKTEIRNPLNRPPYAKKLFVKEIKESKIGIRLTGISGNTGKAIEDPSKWQIHITYNVVDKRKNVRLRSARVRLGKELKKAGNNGDTFILEKIDQKSENDETGGTRYVYTVVLKRVTDNVLFTAKVGEEVLNPQKEVIFETTLSIANDKEIKTVIGTEFSLGNAQTGVDTYITTEATLAPYAENREDRMTAKLKDMKGVIHNIKTRSDMTFNENPGMMFPEPQRQPPRRNNMPTF